MTLNTMSLNASHYDCFAKAYQNEKTGGTINGALVGANLGVLNTTHLMTMQLLQVLLGACAMTAHALLFVDHLLPDLVIGFNPLQLPMTVACSTRLSRPYCSLQGSLTAY